VTRTVGCYFCGQIVPGHVRSVVVQVECPTCGSYEVTLGSIEHLRTSEQLKVAARAVISRERQSGVEMPQINLWVIKELRGY
jgi:predicted RNA-binding Zn-ribbon protein involved in translation (DUF1610 family)